MSPAQYEPISSRRSYGLNKSPRIVKGWGSRKPRPPPGLPPLELEGKSFTEVRDACLSEGRLFEDPDFQADDSNVFYSKRPPRPFVWKRPKDIVSNPKLFVGGASRFDVQQGALGDCWLLAAVASLCQHRNLLDNVIPQDQSFDEDYAGVFHFKLWRFGEWQDVIIDDRLPTLDGKLVFLHSESHNEFWTALLEKAYAKVVGSYESLKGGSTSEAMEDFTGGVTEAFDLTKAPPDLFKIMLKADQHCSLMGCSIDAVPGQLEAALDTGLICGHAYSITSVKLVNVQTPKMKGQLPMVRIRNPWGNEVEWNGAWSDKSKEWSYIPADEKKEIGLTFDDDGEFWMSYSDFSKNFKKLEICNLGPTLEDNSTSHYKANNTDGSWRKNVTAGGCRNFLDTFWINPQYRVQVVDADDDDDEGTLIISLMQKNRRILRKEGQDLLTVGYVIYKVADLQEMVPDSQKRLDGAAQGKTLDVNFFKRNKTMARSPAFVNTRSVCGRHKLPPGEYCVLPSTFEPNQDGDFLLRIYSEKDQHMEEMDEKTQVTTPTVEPEMTETDKVQEQQLRANFKKISGVDMEVDAYELQDILNAAFQKDFKFDGFSAETCRSMVAMMDVDKSGKLGFDEFKTLWTNLRVWKAAFKKHDRDSSGTFNSYELRGVFSSCGYSLSNACFNSLVQRYSHKDGKIYFDDMVHCIVRLKTMFDVFNEQKEDGCDKAEFDLDEFIQITMYS